MNAATTINSPLDDGAQIQQAIKHGLIALSVAIILLSGSALWTIIQLTDFYNSKVNIIAKQDQLVHDMRVAAHERRLLMYAMVTEQDPFKNDDNRMAFYAAGAKFAQARIEFTQTPITDTEQSILKAQGRLTGINQITQDKVVDLATDAEFTSALNLLRESLSVQNKVIQSLDRLVMSIETRKNDINAKASRIENVSIIILVAIVIIIILGTIHIIRQTTSQTSNFIAQLTNTRNALESTNNELIQKKEAVDQHAIVSIADRQGNITYVNDKFCKISGYSRDELLGFNHRILKSDVHSDEFYKDIWSTISSGEIWHGKICNKQKNGEHYWVESTISPFLDANGIPYQYVSIRTDITDLLDAKVEAEIANKAKSTFLMSMSHELRTPMNSVIGYADLLTMDLKGEELKSAQEIIKAGKYLMGLLNEILDLSKIETGKIDFLIEEVNLEDLIDECIVMVECMTFSKNIKLHKQIHTSVGFCVTADRIRLKQSLLNYLTNAMKYNNQDGTVIVTAKIVDSGKCRILVEDSGSGLSKEQCAVVFNPFTRLDKHINLVEGSGIGLTITKRIIEKMNGMVGVDSKENVGSVFWIEIPVAK